MKMVDEHWFMLSWAGKWLGEKKVFGEVLDPTSAKERCDKPLLESLWDVMNEADVIVAHNGAKFDVPKINTRFLAAGMGPPSPFKVVDTLRAARSKFSFTSNRLNDIGEFLGLGGKVDTGGWELWQGCLAGDQKALDKMFKYNKRDITLLEDIYNALLPWITNHPSHGTTSSVGRVCPRCSSTKLQKRGVYTTNVSTYQRLFCTDCGSWSRERSADKNKPEVVGAT